MNDEDMSNERDHATHENRQNWGRGQVVPAQEANAHPGRARTLLGAQNPEVRGTYRLAGLVPARATPQRMAPLDGTAGWHHRMAPQDGITGWYHRMAPQDGTTGWHHRMVPQAVCLPEPHPRGWHPRTCIACGQLLGAAQRAHLSGHKYAQPVPQGLRLCHAVRGQHYGCAARARGPDGLRGSKQQLERQGCGRRGVCCAWPA